MQTWRRYLVRASRYDFWPVKMHFVKKHYLFYSFLSFGPHMGPGALGGAPGPRGGPTRRGADLSLSFTNQFLNLLFGSIFDDSASSGGLFFATVGTHSYVF